MKEQLNTPQRTLESGSKIDLKAIIHLYLEDGAGQTRELLTDDTSGLAHLN